MRKGGEEKGARGARTAPSVDGVVFIFFVAMLMFFFSAEGLLPLGGFLFGCRWIASFRGISFSKTGKF